MSIMEIAKKVVGRLEPLGHPSVIAAKYGLGVAFSIAMILLVNTNKKWSLYAAGALVFFSILVFLAKALTHGFYEKRSRKRAGMDGGEPPDLATAT